MKAFKQIDLRIEKRILFSYSTLLCLASFFVVLSPLLGQTDRDTTQNDPEVKIDIKKYYDEDGNLIGHDSSYSWLWSGIGKKSFVFDSLFDQFKKHSGNFDHLWNEDHFNFSQTIPDSLWHRFQNSEHFSPMDHMFSDKWFENLNFPHLENLNWENFHQPDSSDISYFKHEHWEHLFDDEFKDKFNNQHRDFEENYQQYFDEHQKLIEKYFGNPQKEDKSEPKYDQNNLKPDYKNNSKIKKGKM